MESTPQPKPARGMVFYAKLGCTLGSEIWGIHPVLVLQSARCAKASPTLIVAPITSHNCAEREVTQVPLEPPVFRSGSVILVEQIRTIDKQRLLSFIGALDQAKMREVECALLRTLGFPGSRYDKKEEKTCQNNS